MTALTRYARLETLGRWHAPAGGPGREVVVSFGDATLVLADGSGRPLTHWSLPAVERLNPGQSPAVYAPDEDGSETLEVDDEIMVSAIETVRASLGHRARAPSPRMRRVVLGGVALAALVALAAWAPGYLRAKALDVVPEAKRIEMGATILGHLQAVLGPACRDPRGAEALARLQDRVLGPDGTAVVLPEGPSEPLRLPGNITVLSREMVEHALEPATVAGEMIAAHEAEGGGEPLGRLLDDAGPWAVLRLLTSGNLAAAALADHARRLLADPPAPAAPLDLGPAFARAEVPTTPYAREIDPDGSTTAALVAADAFAGGAAPLLLSDSDWVALQNICRGA